MNNPHKTCQWIGDSTDLTCTCTQTTVLGRSYCKDHIWLVYKEGSAVKRKKDSRRYDRVQQVIDLFNQAVEELEAEGWTPEWTGEVGR